MINLIAKVSVKKLVGQVATVPKAIGGKMQVKTVYPTYEEQRITADEDEDYDGLSLVVVKPKPRPLMETVCTDVMANHIVVNATLQPGGMAGLWTPRNYYYGDTVFQEIPPQLQAFPYIVIKKYSGYYQVLGCSKKLWVNPSKLADTLVLDQSAGSLTYAGYDQTTNAWGTVQSGNFYSEFDEIIWANYDIPNGSQTTTNIYFEGSDPVLVEE